MPTYIEKLARIKTILDQLMSGERSIENAEVELQNLIPADHITPVPQTFEQNLVDQVKQVRAHLANGNLGENHFVFSIKAQGRVNDGEVLIDFKLQTDDGYGEKAQGKDVWTVVDEYCRRLGWNNTNTPLMISNA